MYRMGEDEGGWGRRCDVITGTVRISVGQYELMLTRGVRLVRVTGVNQNTAGLNQLLV